ncbi:MAG: hypothetical protein HY548_01925, partial [Elusimicrobia bacterium]|nr:hypothetical protein [Elusimicrobiota bacterium]
GVLGEALGIVIETLDDLLKALDGSTIEFKDKEGKLIGSISFNDGVMTIKDKDGKVVKEVKIEDIDWDEGMLYFSMNEKGEMSFAISAPMYVDGKEVGTFDIVFDKEKGGLSVTVTFVGPFAFELFKAITGAKTNEEVLELLDGVRMEFKDAQGVLIGGLLFNMGPNGVMEIHKLVATKNPQTGETVLVDGGVIGTFGAGQMDIWSARLTFGKDSSGNSMMSFSVNIVSGGDVIAQLVINVSTNRENKQVTTAMANLFGQFALDILMKMLGVKTVEALLKRLDKVRVEVGEGEDKTGYEFKVDGKQVMILDLDGNVIGSFNADQMDWESAVLTIGNTSDGTTTVSFSVDIKLGDEVIGTFGVSLSKGADGVERLSTLVSFKGERGLEMLMRALGIDPNDENAKEQLYQKLDGSKMVISENGVETGGFMMDYDEATGEIKIFSLVKDEKGEWVQGELLDSMNVADIDWSTAFVTFGSDGKGGAILNFSVSFRKDGKVYGSLNVGLSEDKDGKKQFSYTAILSGLRGRDLLMKILGIDATAADAVQQLWERLDGAELVAYDDNGEVIGGYKLKVDDDGTVHIIRLVADPSDAKKWVEAEEIGSFNLNNVDWSTGSLVLGQNGKGEAQLGFSVDIRDKDGKTIGSFSVSLGERKEGEGQALNFFVTLEGEMAKDILMKMLGAKSMEELWEKLNGAKLIAMDEKGNVIGGFMFEVSADGTVKVFSIVANPDKNAEQKWVKGEEIASFGINDVDWSTSSLTMGRSTDGKGVLFFSAQIKKNGRVIGTFNLNASLGKDGKTMSLNMMVTFTGKFALDLLMKILGVTTVEQLMNKLNGTKLVATKANGDVVGGFMFEMDENGVIHVYELKPDPSDSKDAVKGDLIATFSASDVDWTTSVLSLGVSLRNGQTQTGDTQMSFSADIRRGGQKIGTFNINLSYGADNAQRLSFLVVFTGKFAVDLLMKIVGARSEKELMEKLNGVRFVAKVDGKEVGGFEIEVVDGRVTFYKLVADENGAGLVRGEVMFTFSGDDVDWNSATISLGQDSSGKAVLSFGADIRKDGKVVATFNVSLQFTKPSDEDQGGPGGDPNEGQGSQTFAFSVTFTGETALRMLMEMLGVKTAEELRDIFKDITVEFTQTFEPDADGNTPDPVTVPIPLSDLLGIGSDQELTFGFDSVSLTLGRTAGGGHVFAFTVDLIVAKTGQKIGQISIFWDEVHKGFSYMFTLELSSPIARDILISFLKKIFQVTTDKELEQALKGIEITFRDANGNDITMTLGEIVMMIKEGKLTSGTFTFGYTSDKKPVFSFSANLGQGQTVQVSVSKDRQVSATLLVNGDIREVWGLKMTSQGVYELVTHYALENGRIVKLRDGTWGTVDGHKLTEKEVKLLNDTAAKYGVKITSLSYDKNRKEIELVGSGPGGLTYHIGISLEVPAKPAKESGKMKDLGPKPGKCDDNGCPDNNKKSGGGGTSGTPPRVVTFYATTEDGYLARLPDGDYSGDGWGLVGGKEVTKENAAQINELVRITGSPLLGLTLAMVPDEDDPQGEKVPVIMGIITLSTAVLRRMLVAYKEAFETWMKKLESIEITYIDSNGNTVTKKLSEILQMVLDGALELDGANIAFGITPDGQGNFSLDIDLGGGQTVSISMSGNILLISFKANGVEEVWGYDTKNNYNVVTHYKLENGRLVELSDGDWGLVDGHKITEKEAQKLNQKADELGGALSQLHYNSTTAEVMAVVTVNGVSYHLGVAMRDGEVALTTYYAIGADGKLVQLPDGDGKTWGPVNGREITDEL